MDDRRAPVAAQALAESKQRAELQKKDMVAHLYEACGERLLIDILGLVYEYAPWGLWFQTAEAPAPASPTERLGPRYGGFRHQCGEDYELVWTNGFPSVNPSDDRMYLHRVCKHRQVRQPDIVVRAPKCGGRSKCHFHHPAAVNPCCTSLDCVSSSDGKYTLVCGSGGGNDGGSPDSVVFFIDWTEPVEQTKGCGGVIDMHHVRLPTNRMISECAAMYDEYSECFIIRESDIEEQTLRNTRAAFRFFWDPKTRQVKHTLIERFGSTGDHMALRIGGDALTPFGGYLHCTCNSYVAPYGRDSPDESCLVPGIFYADSFLPPRLVLPLPTHPKSAATQWEDVVVRPAKPRSNNNRRTTDDLLFAIGFRRGPPHGLSHDRLYHFRLARLFGSGVDWTDSLRYIPPDLQEAI